MQVSMHNFKPLSAQEGLDTSCPYGIAVEVKDIKGLDGGGRH